MKTSHSFTTLKLLTLAVALSTTALVADAQERPDSTRTQAPQNATKSMPAKSVQTDGQILQIIRSLNDAEIKQAKLVMDESESVETKVVAQSILNDHEDS